MEQMGGGGSLGKHKGVNRSLFCHACEKIIRGTFRFLSMYVYMYTYVKDIRRSTGQNLQLERDAARERERRRGREEQEDDLDSNGE